MGLVEDRDSPVLMPSVLIVDDSLLARHGLRHLLSQEHRGLVFGEAKSFEEATAYLAKRPWDVVVIEVSMPGHDGFQMLQEIRRSYPATRVLILSPQTNPEHAFRARQLKATGYVGKNSLRGDMLRAFRSVFEGKEHFLDTNHDGSGAWAMPVPLRPPLSGRERDVLVACVAGKRVGEIAADLNLSIKTVSTYKRRILNKLQLKSVADLVRHAIDHKLC
jgi:two-component system, NarL family, invasion response regulator UvrY